MLSVWICSYQVNKDILQVIGKGGETIIYNSSTYKRALNRLVLSDGKIQSRNSNSCPVEISLVGFMNEFFVLIQFSILWTKKIQFKTDRNVD